MSWSDTTAPVVFPKDQEERMRKRSASGALAAITAAALSVPAVGLANKGGTPHSTKPCPTHKHQGKHKGSSKGKKKGSSKGKKCSKA